ncbi:MAG: hypothetical protein QGF00_32290, partial [Planctomycetota bacterium]|nr:hypothetical protein [Planctomycetota bacterium]
MIELNESHASFCEPARQQAVEAYGARVERVAGNYDDSVHQVDHDGRQNTWQIVSDTSYPGY